MKKNKKRPINFQLFSRLFRIEDVIEMKVIAWYLPQFHEIPENNEFWGEGFTEWTNMKKATPLYEGHYQPRIPLNRNYYDLSNWKVIEQQSVLAKKYGIYGFCFYHYWFSDRILLKKPMENLLRHPHISIPFCVCWANESWTNTWVSNNKKVLIKQTYGDKEEWKRHFDYLNHFFSDPRYIKEDGCPFIVIYRPDNIPCLEDMLDYWRQLSVKEGYSGLKISYQHVCYHMRKNKKSCFDYGIEYQPMYALEDEKTKHEKVVSLFKDRLSIVMQNVFGKAPEVKRNKVIRIDYSSVWESVLKRHGDGQITMIPGAFVDWDNTPRRGIKGIVFSGATPSEFEKYMVKQIYNAKENYKSDKIFLFAWNEWAEGGYLEPDERYGYSYLEALRNALVKTGEFPSYSLNGEG